MARSPQNAARAGRSAEVEQTSTAFNPWRDFCVQLPSSIDTVHAVRQHAIENHKPGRANPSHRGYYVATLLAAFSHDEDEASLMTLTAINTKPRGHSDGVCSELRTTAKVEKLNERVGEAPYEILGLVVMGDPQPDQATGFEAGTLWVCSERCWPNIIEPGRLARDALIVTVRPDKRKAQVQTAGELDEFYTALLGGEQPREPDLVDHRPSDWEAATGIFDNLIPRDLDPFESLEARALCVEAVRTAIQQRPMLHAV